MKNNDKVDFKMRKNRLLLWLTVVLTMLLLATVGVFIFLSLNAKYQFACLFECKQGESVVARKHGSWPTGTASVTAVYNVTTASLKTAHPEIIKSKKPTQKGKMRTRMTQKTTAFFTIDHEVIRLRTSSKTSATSAFRKTTSAPAIIRSNVKQSTSALVMTPMSLHATRKPLVNLKNYISISGNISFKGMPPKRFPRNSRLIVKFVDDSLQDASWTVLGQTVVNLSKQRRRKTLSYTITCKRPELVPEFDEFDSSYYYSVNAVVNMGWKRNKNNWIRRGDYFTDTHFGVHITKHKRLFVKNIQLVKYTY